MKPNFKKHAGLGFFKEGMVSLIFLGVNTLLLLIQSFGSQTNAQSFSQTGQVIELCCGYLYVKCIQLYVIIR